MRAPIIGFVSVDSLLEEETGIISSTPISKRSPPGWHGWLGYWGLREQRPIHDLDNEVWVVYEGTIQNRRELQAKLVEVGFPPRTEEPGELILCAYQAWGEQASEAIEGTCAFLLWDANRQRLLATRDRAGMQRLYLAQDEGTLLVSTDMRALLELRKHASKPDPRALAFVLALGYVPAGFSIWQGVINVGIGQYVTWTLKEGMQLHSYWEPPRVSQEESSLSWKEIFEAAMEDALAGNEPVGLLLSGGLDSSSIALASTRLGRPVTALSLGAPGVPDEANLAMRLAEYLGLPTVGPVHIPTQDVNSVLDEVVVAMQEPQCHPAILTSHVMSQAASPYFKILLTGDGAEEVLGGYKWYDAQDTPYRNWRLATSLRHLVRGMLSARPANTKHRRLVEQFTGTSALHRHVWHTYKAMFMPMELRALFGPSFGEVFTEKDMLAPLHVHYEPALPYRRSLQRLDMMTFCAEALLPKVRRIAAAQGMEVRLPFLDRRVIDWALAYPYEKRERKQRKPLLHDYLRGHVPEAILKLPKHGFNPPWLQGLNWEQSLNEIRTGYWVKEGYWSATALQEFVKKGAPCWQQRLWSLTVLTRWASVWVK